MSIVDDDDVGEAMLCTETKVKQVAFDVFTAMDVDP